MDLSEFQAELKSIEDVLAEFTADMQRPCIACPPITEATLRLRALQQRLKNITPA